ncbi:MAG: response regulator transcription factor [Nannocystaceae bacterium]
MSTKVFKRVLLIEDSPALVRTLTRVFEGRGCEVFHAGTVELARIRLTETHPDLALLDFALPDGTGLDVLEYMATIHPVPTVVAMTGSAAPTESFRLAEMGVRAYLRKPIDLTELEQTIARVEAQPPVLRHHVRELVGRVPVKDVEEEVRKVMVDEALSRSEGNKRGAARLLKISRQLLQHIIRKFED